MESTMPFQVSPGVNVSEIDLTTVVPAVSTTEGAVSGVFRWGPVDKRILIDSENNLVSRFGKPTNHNPETFFSAANFLAYGNKLYVSRAANTIGFSNAISTLSTSGANTTVTGFANVSNSGIAAGMLVYGNNIARGTTVSSLGNTSDVSNTTAIVLSTASLGTVSSNTLIFVSANAVFSAVANQSGMATSLALYNVKNEDDYDIKVDSFGSEVAYVARFPGDLGNSLKVSVCDSANQYNSNIEFSSSSYYVGANTSNTYNLWANAAVSNIAFTTGSNTATLCVYAANATITNAQIGNLASTIAGLISVNDIIEAGNSTIGKQYLKVTSVGSVANVANTLAAKVQLSISFDTNYNITTNSASNTVTRYWEFFGNVDAAPGRSDFVTNFGNSSANDELHVVVTDEDGKFTGVPGTILEVFSGVSRATDAKTNEGATNYYKTVINDNSAYIWWAKDRTTAVSNTATNIASATSSLPMSISFGFGSDGDNENNVAISVLSAGYDLFKSAEDVDISLIVAGKARGGSNGQQLANYIIDNICETRKDCVAFVSPDKPDVVQNTGRDESNDIITFRNSLTTTSYAVMDSGYKYQYDRYNDVYRYIPLNGDMAGLAVRTDDTRDPWFSPAGFNRGVIKNVIKLAYNPGKADRDVLYKAGVNPVVTFPGQGTILYGDKTLLAKPSAFDRINVRRLFIVLEKAISTAAKFTLFELNDEFTRAQFKNLIEPFLRDVQGRRGIYDFKVVCDETNNTPEVIDRNEFVGDIYIKPARSINFIQLNFVAVRTGVEFSEIVGQF
jgi:hypothetical protein